jgi:hypothetical protein
VGTDTTLSNGENNYLKPSTLNLDLNFNKQTIKPSIHLILDSKVLFWSIIVIFPVLTFNFYSPDYNIGLDPSYAWAYNSLLLNKFSIVIVPASDRIMASEKTLILTNP